MEIIAFIIYIVAVAIGYAISWVIFVGALWGIAWCFSIPFSLKIVTGIWLAICLIRITPHRGSKE